MKLGNLFLIGLAKADESDEQPRRGVRGFVGPSAGFISGESPWPVKGCTENRHCWATSIQKFDDWKDYDVKFLMCNTDTGLCECRPNYMDADDDVTNGCEKQFNDDLCPEYGTCKNHGAVNQGEQCGVWKFLTCQDRCCQCIKKLPDGRCIDEAVYDVDPNDERLCETLCDAKCEKLTDNTQECIQRCTSKFCANNDGSDTSGDLCMEKCTEGCPAGDIVCESGCENECCVVNCQNNECKNGTPDECRECTESCQPGDGDNTGGDDNGEIDGVPCHQDCMMKCPLNDPACQASCDKDCCIETCQEEVCATGTAAECEKCKTSCSPDDGGDGNDDDETDEDIPCLEKCEPNCNGDAICLRGCIDDCCMRQCEDVCKTGPSADCEACKNECNPTDDGSDNNDGDDNGTDEDVPCRDQCASCSAGDTFCLMECMNKCCLDQCKDVCMTGQFADCEACKKECNSIDDGSDNGGDDNSGTDEDNGGDDNNNGNDSGTDEDVPCRDQCTAKCGADNTPCFMDCMSKCCLDQCKDVCANGMAADCEACRQECDPTDDGNDNGDDDNNDGDNNGTDEDIPCRDQCTAQCPAGNTLCFMNCLNKCCLDQCQDVCASGTAADCEACRTKCDPNDDGSDNNDDDDNDGETDELLCRQDCFNNCQTHTNPTQCQIQCMEDNCDPNDNSGDGSGDSGNDTCEDKCQGDAECLKKCFCSHECKQICTANPNSSECAQCKKECEGDDSGNDTCHDNCDADDHQCHKHCDCHQKCDMNCMLSDNYDGCLEDCTPACEQDKPAPDAEVHEICDKTCRKKCGALDFFEASGEESGEGSGVGSTGLADSEAEDIKMCWTKCKDECYSFIFEGDDDSDDSGNETDDDNDTDNIDVVVPELDCQKECDKRCDDISSFENAPAEVIEEACNTDKCLQICEGWNNDEEVDACETVRCPENSYCDAFQGRPKCLCNDGYEPEKNELVGFFCRCVKDCDNISTTGKPTTVSPTTVTEPIKRCDTRVLGDLVKAFCSRVENHPFGADYECAVKCQDRLVPFWQKQPVEALICKDGQFYIAGFEQPDIDMPMKSLIPVLEVLVDGPLQCDKPVLVVDDIADDLLEASPCRDASLFRCQANSQCVPAVGAAGTGYTCECNDGFKLNGKVCEEVKPAVDLTDEDRCPADFRDNLKKLKINDLKRPKIFSGRKSVIMQVETQVKFLGLNYETYTAFMEFNVNNCGKAFVKAVAGNQVNFNVYDSERSDGLYTVVGSHGIFFKTASGFGASGAVVQLTKNFPTLGDMLEDPSVFEINQSKNAKKRIVPARDTFYFVIDGDIVDPDEMGANFATCFSPKSLQMYMVHDVDYYRQNQNWPVYEEDYTKCFYKSKLSDHLDVNCKAPAVINGEITDATDILTVLFDSDLKECVAEN